MSINLRIINTFTFVYTILSIFLFSKSYVYIYMLLLHHSQFHLFTKFYTSVLLAQVLEPKLYRSALSRDTWKNLFCQQSVYFFSIRNTSPHQVRNFFFLNDTSKPLANNPSASVAISPLLHLFLASIFEQL